ncbi:copper resistance protein CopC [Methylopila sp. M107]|uniref:copper resistance CopC/CopD family protein n=1 Tax=Methylopila sp. M107 TaxID=1101190 RepID=UPI00037054AB|nr:copper resistance protein CopC [Methylopila sp. M107]
MTARAGAGASFRSLSGLLLMLAALLAPAAARAHATLTGSVPADGAVVETAPKSFRLGFNEPVAVTGVRLSGGGRTLTLDRVSADGAAVVIEAPPDLAAGSYALSYRVVSEDGHPIAGALSFAIGAPGGGPAPELDPLDAALDAAIWLVRAALYLGLVFGAGGAFALAWLAGGASHGRRTVAGFAALGLVAAPAALALQGADLVGAPLAQAFQTLAWRQALATSYAATVAIAAATLVLALLSLALKRGAAQAASALALGGIGAALAASGHASAAAPQWLMRGAVFLHATAAAFWIGALAPLLAAMRDGASDRALRSFSAAAPYALAILFVAGTTLAVRQVESVGALLTTSYGLVLSAKLGLVALLLALAAANRWRFARPALAGDRVAARTLRRSIAFELVVGAVILGVVALWRFTPPPRSLALVSAEPALAHLQTRAAQADVTVQPGRVGAADVSIMVMTGDYGPLDAKQITVVLSNPAAGVEGIRREARKPGDGTWRVDGVQLPAPGAWTVRLEVLVTDYDIERLEGRIDIRP